MLSTDGMHFCLSTRCLIVCFSRGVSIDLLLTVQHKKLVSFEVRIKIVQVVSVFQKRLILPLAVS